ncbi:hypothetical protein J4Q44_G00383620 [Coregonus suidteri]|uniref:Uncharacterized protein n=1 Tax=Coregonus suidteri TaxID=861788 RepID=A0AAN8Q9C4_9TELE
MNNSTGSPQSILRQGLCRTPLSCCPYSIPREEYFQTDCGSCWMEAEGGHFLQDLAQHVKQIYAINKEGAVTSDGPEEARLLVVGEAAWGTESVLGPTSAYRGMVTERRGSSTLRSGTPVPDGPVAVI